MTTVDFNERLYRTYHKARTLDAAAIELWMDAVRRHTGDLSGVCILDLGCGTGRFCGPLADTFSARVIGVEPSDNMLAAAGQHSQHRGVRYLKGSAEQIPMEDSTCDFAWLSQIVHHLEEFDAPVRELRRVLKPSGLVFIRNNFKARLADCLYYRFFPSALQIDEARHPGVDALRDAFQRNGFRFSAFETLHQIVDPSLRDYAKRIGERGYSTLELISDEEFEQGLHRMQEAAANENPPRPVRDPVDLLVLRLE